MRIRQLLPSSTIMAVSVCLCLAILTMVLLAGCSATSGTRTKTGNSSTPVSSSTRGTGGSSTPTSGTTSKVQNCQQLPGFSGAGPIPEGGRLSNVPFPSNAVSTEASDVVNQTGLYEVLEFNVCAPGTTPTAIRSYYASQFPSMGWTQSSTYPYDGGYQASCGDPYCWKVGSTPEYSSLEVVTAPGSGFVTYRMRLAFPPTVPDCSSILPPGNPLVYYFFWDQQPTVPLPPLTVEGLGDGHSVGSKTVYSQTMCSPGTAASINAYMSKEMSHHGWSSTSQTLCGTTGWDINSSGLALKWSVTDPKDWTMSFCQ
jgi:hypothetical protein